MNQVLKGIPTVQLQAYIPHRPPMVWVDEVLHASLEAGECLVQLKEDALYLDENKKLRPTSLIEFIAQSYAFSSAAYYLHSPLKTKPVKETFLVGINDFEHVNFDDYPEIYTDRKLTVKLSAAREIGPILIFSGSVWTSKNKCIGKAKVKVYINRG